MIKKFFQKIGIYLSLSQERLVKIALAVALVSLLYIPPAIFAPPRPNLTLNAEPYQKASGLEVLSGQYLNYLEFTFDMLTSPEDRNYGGVKNGQIGLLIYTGMSTLLFVGLSVFFLIAFLHYCGKLVLNKQFRISEMSQSVNYLERDEREQFQTMLATRRAYMVVNFFLLVGWLFNLLNGNFNIAFWLFIIQIIGAVSFRQQMQPKKK